MEVEINTNFPQKVVVKTEVDSDEITFEEAEAGIKTLAENGIGISQIETKVVKVEKPGDELTAVNGNMSNGLNDSGESFTEFEILSTFSEGDIDEEQEDEGVPDEAIEKMFWAANSGNPQYFNDLLFANNRPKNVQQKKTYAPRKRKADAKSEHSSKKIRDILEERKTQNDSQKELELQEELDLDRKPDLDKESELEKEPEPPTGPEPHKDLPKDSQNNIGTVPRIRKRGRKPRGYSNEMMMIEKPPQVSLIDYSVLTSALTKCLQEHLVGPEKDVKIVVFSNNKPVKSFSLKNNIGEVKPSDNNTAGSATTTSTTVVSSTENQSESQPHTVFGKGPSSRPVTRRYTTNLRIKDGTVSNVHNKGKDDDVDNHDSEGDKDENRLVINTESFSGQTTSQAAQHLSDDKIQTVASTIAKNGAKTTPAVTDKKLQADKTILIPKFTHSGGPAHEDDLLSNPEVSDSVKKILNKSQVVNTATVELTEDEFVEVEEIEMKTEDVVVDPDAAPNYTCQYCNRPYVYRRSLNAHIASAHSDLANIPERKKRVTVRETLLSKRATNTGNGKAKAPLNLSSILPDKQKEERASAHPMKDSTLGNLVNLFIDKETMNIMSKQNGIVLTQEQVDILTRSRNIIPQSSSQTSINIPNDPQATKAIAITCIKKEPQVEPTNVAMNNKDQLSPESEGQGDSTPVYICEYCGKHYNNHKSLKIHFTLEHTKKIEEENGISLTADQIDILTRSQRSESRKKEPSPAQSVQTSLPEVKKEPTITVGEQYVQIAQVEKEPPPIEHVQMSQVKKEPSLTESVQMSRVEKESTPQPTYVQISLPETRKEKQQRLLLTQFQQEILSQSQRLETLSQGQSSNELQSSNIVPELQSSNIVPDVDISLVKTEPVEETTLPVEEGKEKFQQIHSLFTSGPFAEMLHSKNTSQSTKVNSLRSMIRSVENSKIKNPKDPPVDAEGDMQPVFVCEHCGKYYRARKTLKDHFMREHAKALGEEPLYLYIAGNKYQCSICFNYYHSSSELLAHTKTHTGELRCKCSICNKEYSSIHVLRRHIDLCHAEVRPRPFRCELCDYAASNKWHLKEHHRRHTGEQPFSCPICSKSFSHQGTMNRHCKTIHKFDSTTLSREQLRLQQGLTSICVPSLELTTGDLSFTQLTGNKEEALSDQEEPEIALSSLSALAGTQPTDHSDSNHSSDNEGAMQIDTSIVKIEPAEDY